MKTTTYLLSGSLLLSSLVAPAVEAWTTSASRRPSTGLWLSVHDDMSEPDATALATRLSSASRRQWLTHVTAAVVATSTSASYTLPSHADASKSSELAQQQPPAQQLRPIVTTAATCDKTVSVWKEPNRHRLVYLLGTAHISKVSAELARQLVRDVHPDAVFVELDLKRVGGIQRYARQAQTQQQQQQQQQAQLPPASSASSSSVVSSTASAAPATVSTSASSSTAFIASTSAVDTSALVTADDATLPLPPSTSEGGGLVGGLQRRALNFGAAALGNAIRQMYKNLGDAGFQPGEEFMAAVQEAQQVDAAVILGDQDVDYTLRRLTQALARTDLNKLNDENLGQKLQEIMPGGPQLPAGGQNLNKEELAAFVEKLKSRDNVRKIMGELRQVAPALVQVMLDERDAFMAMGLDTYNQFGCIVAVIGLAHMDGIERNLRQKGWQPVALRCPVRF